MTAKPLAHQLNALVAKFSNRVKRKLPCLLIAGGCATTTLDSFAYIWDTPKNCVLTKFLTQDETILHYPLTTDQKENLVFFLSEFNNAGKGMDIKYKVFVNYQGGFAVPGGELRTMDFSSNAYQFWIQSTSQFFNTSISLCEVNGKWVGAQP